MIKRTLSVPVSVLALLALGAPANALVFNDFVDAAVQAHRDRQSEIVDSQQAILARIDTESREPTVEEGKELDELAAEFESLENTIQRRLRAQAQTSALTASAGRQAEADPIDGDAPAVVTPQAAARPAAAAPAGGSARVPAAPRVSANGNFGFRNMGEFARSVRSAHPSFGSNVDQRLIRNASASTFASEGIGQDGGFLVPPDFRSEIVAHVFGEESLVALSRRMQSTSNSITMPIDTTTPWGGAGVLSYWTAEGGTKNQSKPQFENVTVKAHTLATLVPVTEELLEDSPALDGYLRMSIPREMDFKISNAIIRGSGSGQPFGILNSGALVTVAAESGQAADTILAANVLKMFARLPSGSQRSAVWIAHPDTLPQLATMTIGNQPVFMPAGGLTQSPHATLLGRPLVFHQVAETVGDVGDLMLVDFNEYLSLTKTGSGRDTNGMRSDVSIHLWFDQDLVAYRFTIRIGGQPLWNASISQRDGSNAQSPYVVLAAR